MPASVSSGGFSTIFMDGRTSLSTF